MKPMPKAEIPLTPAGCRQARELIETAEAESHYQTALSAHCLRCPACQRHSQQIINLRGLIANQARVAAPNDFDFKLRQRIAASKKPLELTWWQMVRQPAMSAAAAAMVLLALLVGIDRYIQQPGHDPVTTQLATDAKPVNKITAPPAKQIVAPPAGEVGTQSADRTVASNFHHSPPVQRVVADVRPRVINAATMQPRASFVVYGAQPVVDVVNTDDLDNGAHEESAIF